VGGHYIHKALNLNYRPEIFALQERFVALRSLVPANEKLRLQTPFVSGLIIDREKIPRLWSEAEVLVTVQTVGVFELTCKACPKLNKPLIFDLSTKLTAASTMCDRLPTNLVLRLTVICIAAFTKLNER
jgi:hypothetical protein